MRKILWKTWALPVAMVLCVLVLVGAAVAWQQSQTSNAAIVAAMKLQAMQSVPAIPMPAITVPFDDVEYNEAADYCERVVAFMKNQQTHVFREVQSLRDRMSTPLMAAYYASRPDWEQEMDELIDFLEVNAHLIDEEVEDDIEGLRALVITADNFLEDWAASGLLQDKEFAKLAMAFAYQKAIHLCEVDANGFNLAFLNISYDLLATLWDEIAKHEYDAGMEQTIIEAGAHI